MRIFYIILITILLVFACFCLYMWASYRSLLKQARKYKTVGTVISCEKSRIPMMWVAFVSYTKSGRPYQATTKQFPFWKKPKIGSKRMYTFYVCGPKSKQFVIAG